MNLLQLILVLIAFKKIEYGKAAMRPIAPSDIIITSQGIAKGVEVKKGTMINQKTVELSCFKYNGGPKAQFIANDNNGYITENDGDGTQNIPVYGTVLQNPEGKCGDMPKYTGKSIHVVLPEDQNFAAHVSKIILVDEDKKTILLLIKVPTAGIDDVFCPKLKARVCQCFSEVNKEKNRNNHCPNANTDKMLCNKEPGNSNDDCPSKAERKDSSDGCLVKDAVKNDNGGCKKGGGDGPTSPGSTGAQKSKLNKISLFFIMTITIINFFQ